MITSILMMNRNIVSKFVLLTICLAAVVMGARPVVKAQNTKQLPPRRAAELYVQTGHTAPVYSIVFSPDGQMLASGSWDFSIKLWDVASGREIRAFPGDSYVYSIAFSPDGKMLASGAADGENEITALQAARYQKRSSWPVLSIRPCCRT